MARLGFNSNVVIVLLVDIYLPDMKFMATKEAEIYMAGAADYPAMGKKALLEMHRQVGDLQLDTNGIAQRGLLVRHLVLPANIAGTDKVLAFLAQEISTNTYLNLMDQYHPCYRANEYPLLARPITGAEYDQALQLAEHYGLQRLDRRHTRLI